MIIVCGGALLGWITHTSWKQLEQLQKEHAAVRSETFYLGVTLRSGIRSLNGKLLQYGRSRETAIAEAFDAEAKDLHQWVQMNRLHVVGAENSKLIKTLGLADDLQFLDKVDDSFTAYLASAERILSPESPPPALDTFEKVYIEVQNASWELLGLCDQLVALQGRGFEQFLYSTQRTLSNHQRLLQITLALIIVMAATLALQVYRGMIAPLRRGLSRSEKIIERQEKLASLGVLASGVAHEIRNPLTAIKFRLFSLEKTVPELAGNEDASIISNEINRLERIVKDFLRFARPSEPELSIVSTTRALTEVQRLLRDQFERHGKQLFLTPGPDLTVRADPHQLKQVLINLLQNAAEAIDGPGAITIQAREDQIDLNDKQMRVAVLSISDTGRGISPSIEERLFDPFFSTKDRGTGLGLAIASRIVEKHGGVLRYETELDRGTTFEVVLPMTNDSSNIAAH